MTKMKTTIPIAGHMWKMARRCGLRTSSLVERRRLPPGKEVTELRTTCLETFSICLFEERRDGMEVRY